MDHFLNPQAGRLAYVGKASPPYLELPPTPKAISRRAGPFSRTRKPGRLAYVGKASPPYFFEPTSNPRAISRRAGPFSRTCKPGRFAYVGKASRLTPPATFAPPYSPLLVTAFHINARMSDSSSMILLIGLPDPCPALVSMRIRAGFEHPWAACKVAANLNE